jgi:hypothetical protein
MNKNFGILLLRKKRILLATSSLAYLIHKRNLVCPLSHGLELCLQQQIGREGEKWISLLAYFLYGSLNCFKLRIKKRGICLLKSTAFNLLQQVSGDFKFSISVSMLFGNKVPTHQISILLPALQ